MRDCSRRTPVQRAAISIRSSGYRPRSRVSVIATTAAEGEHQDNNERDQLYGDLLFQLRTDFDLPARMDRASIECGKSVEIYPCQTCLPHQQVTVSVGSCLVNCFLQMGHGLVITYVMVLLLG